MDVFGELATTIALAICAGVVTTIGLSKSRWQNVHTARWIDRVFLLLVIAFVVTYSALALVRYYSFATDTTDLAQYGQMTWNALRGRPFENSLIPDAPLFLAKSFIPIMLAFVPVYAVWSDPASLMVAQVIALASGAFPIYWFARATVGRALGLGVAFAYLVSPVVTQMISYEFHEIALATPLLAYAAFFLLRERYRPFLVTLAVTLLVKEEIAFVTAGIGAFIFLFQRQYRFGFALALFGVAWGAFLLSFVIPFFHGSEPGKFYYFSGGWIAGGASRYSYLGSSFSEIIVTLLTRPDLVLPHLFTREKIQFVLQLCAPLAFLSLLGADIAFLALPTLGYSLLSNFSWQYRMDTAYPAPLLPFLFYAATIGAVRLLRWSDAAPIQRIARQGGLLTMLLVASASNYFLYAHGFGTRGFQPEWYTLTEHSRIGNALLREIPGDAFVIAQNEFLAHLSNRQGLYEIPTIPDFRQADYLFADPTHPWFQVHAGYWRTALDSNFFQIVTQRDGYLIARQMPAAQATTIRFGDQISLLGYTLAPTETVRGGMTLHPILEWRAERTMTTRYVIAVQVIDTRGHVWANDEREPHDGKSPTNHWQVGKTIRDQSTLALPPTMPAGEYQVAIALRDLDGNALGDDTMLTTIQVEKNNASFTARDLRIEQPLQVDMREMRLLGFVPPRATIAPGELLQVGVYWRARGKPQGDYLVAVQLRDASGKIAFEHASRPANDTYPTMQWEIGEVLLDWHDFNLPQNLAPGRYDIVVVLRDRESVLGEIRIASLTVVK